MATNNVRHKLSASSRSVINSGLTDDYRQAIVEYIWNGFDAEAKIVDVQYQRADDVSGDRFLTQVGDTGTGPLSRNDRSAALDNTSNYKIILAKHV